MFRFYVELADDLFKGGRSSIFGVSQLGRDVYVPMTKRLQHCFEPFRNACFTSVDFLPSTNKTNDYGPFLMSIQIMNQKLRFRLFKISHLLASLHEIRSLLCIPCTLRLIEDNNVIVRRIGAPYAFISEVMDILDKWLHFLTYCSLAHAFR